LREETAFAHSPVASPPGGLTVAMSFGQWLKEARKRRRLSQEGLARAAGCTGSYISLLERAAPDKRSGAALRPSVEVVDAVAAALGVTRREARLAAGYVPPDDAGMSANEVRLLESYRALPASVRSVVDTQIEALRERYTREP
jgi:transcriptional regulator with XRE-family HTH domain